jgi:hypothetical protein
MSWQPSKTGPGIEWLKNKMADHSQTRQKCVRFSNFSGYQASGFRMLTLVISEAGYEYWMVIYSSGNKINIKLRKSMHYCHFSMNVYNNVQIEPVMWFSDC